MQNVIRHGYYVALDNQSVHTDSLHQYHTQPSHLRHCFDYLRQALQCATDTNLEPVDFELGGINGWGVSRVCRDYESAKRWAEKWRASDRKHIL